MRASKKGPQHALDNLKMHLLHTALLAPPLHLEKCSCCSGRQHALDGDDAHALAGVGAAVDGANVLRAAVGAVVPRQRAHPRLPRPRPLGRRPPLRRRSRPAMHTEKTSLQNFGPDIEGIDLLAW